MPSALPSNSERYTPLAMFLHWLIALVLLAQFCFGLYMADLPLSPTKLKLYSYHKWAGVSVFMLVALRLCWRGLHAPPPLPYGTPAWQVKVAGWGHALLYVLMFLVPLSGWLMSSAKGFQTVYFGVWPIPDLLAKDEALGSALVELHAWLNMLLALVVLGHVGAALKHQYIDRDGLLLRMMPRRRGR